MWQPRMNYRSNISRDVVGAERIYFYSNSLFCRFFFIQAKAILIQIETKDVQYKSLIMLAFCVISKGQF